MPSTASDALPNFFIVGAPKAGTTSLYHYLDQHPQVYMSPIKEPCYFASEVRPENFSDEMQPQVRRQMDELGEYLQGSMSTKRFGGLVTTWEDYLKLFRNVQGETAIGEASVCYLWSETAPRNIAARIPDARLIMILRDPAERAVSQYWHAVTNGLVRMPFREYLDASLACTDQRFRIVYPCLELGLYYRQVQRCLETFPRERIRIYFYEDYQRDPYAILRDVFLFLGVDPDFSPDTSRRELEPRVPRLIGASYFLKKSGLWRAAKNLLPPSLRRTVKKAVFHPRRSLTLEPEDRAYLVEYYRKDIESLSALLNRDLRSWL